MGWGIIAVLGRVPLASTSTCDGSARRRVRGARFGVRRGLSVGYAVVFVFRSECGFAGQERTSLPFPFPPIPPKRFFRAPKNTKLTLPPFLAAWQVQARQLEEFVRDFKAARKVFHKRALWSERWNRGEVSWQED